MSKRKAWRSGILLAVLALLALGASQALGAFNVNYCGQLGDGTPHCTSGPGWQPDGGYSNNDLSVMRAYTGQNSTNICTSHAGYACPRSVILVDSGGSWSCYTNDYNSTTSCGYSPSVYSRAYCSSSVTAAPPAPFGPWGNCWKRRVN